MKRVILTIGPQYAGKSTFCEKVIENFPSVVLSSRDKILVRMFGTVWLDSYSGGHYAAWDELMKEVAVHLQQPEVTLILDAWNGSSKERRELAEKLRNMGANRIDGWHFITPVEKCLEWSYLRDPVKTEPNKWSEVCREIRADTYRRHHKAFNPKSIAEEGVLDSIRRFNSIRPIPKNILIPPRAVTRTG